MSQRRIGRLLDAFADLHVDAVLITDPINRRYLTGYTGADHGLGESAGVLLVAPDEVILLADRNNLAWAASEADSSMEVRAWERPWVTTVAEIVKDRAWQRLGFEDSAMLVSTHRALKDLLGADQSLSPIGGRATLLRSIKDDAEIDALERAIRLTDQVAIDISMKLTPGATEREIANEIDDLFRAGGAEGPGFSTSVASGSHSARPHHSSSDRKIQPGDAIIIDMGAQIDGYTADLSRTFWVGSAPSDFKTVYNAVARAHAASLGRVRSGARGADIDRAARESLAADGFGANVIHSVGHGVGLEVHEAPAVSIHADDVLEAGQVITIEPGLYFPEWGGVRIEDVVLVTADGCRTLSAAPK